MRILWKMLAYAAAIGAVSIAAVRLLAMSVPIQRAIVGAAFEALRPGGVFIQFTYGLGSSICSAVREELNLGWTRSQRIWDNLPPATTYTFYRKNAN